MNLDIRGSTDLAQPFGEQIRVSSPSMLGPGEGIKRQPCGLGTCSLGQVARFCCQKRSCAALNQTAATSSLSDIRRELQKEFDPITICLFLGTRKGVPTNRAGTPDGAHLEGPALFAKPFF